MAAPWTLRKVFAHWQCKSVYHGADAVLDAKIPGVSTDSRRLRKGDVFVALRGDHFDGHDFIEAALRAGALACFVEGTWWAKRREGPVAGNFIVVEDTLRALQDLGRTYRRFLDPRMIALTGTNGKTTTKEMIAAVLAQKWRVHKTEGNLNNHIGVPLTLLAMPEKTEIAVVEMGTNNFGEIATLCEIAEPEYGLITNIGRGHTEFFRDVAGVQRAKQELFDYLAETGLAVINQDDALVVEASQRAGIGKKHTYGFTGPADTRGDALQLNVHGHAEFMCEGRKVTVGTPGLHNAANALAAIAVGRLFQVPPEACARALARPLQISGRMILHEIAGRRIIDDTYNANPESMRAAIDYLAQMPHRGEKFAALGDMLELGGTALADHREVIQYALDRGVREVFAFGPVMAEAVASFADSAGRVTHFALKEELAEELIKLSGAGDVILVKGSRGMRMEEVISALQNKPKNAWK